ncbi:hypothetical protein AMTRI_Chr06g172530 [Amborella trichopoda]
MQALEKGNALWRRETRAGSACELPPTLPPTVQRWQAYQPRALLLLHLSLSTDASNPSLSLSLNHMISKTIPFLSLKPEDPYLSLAPSFYLPQAHLLLHLSPSTDASTPSLSKPHKTKPIPFLYLKPEDHMKTKTSFLSIFYKLQEP